MVGFELQIKGVGSNHSTICATTTAFSVTRKILPNVYKSCPKIFQLKNYRFWHLYKNFLRLWEIWSNALLPKALKSGPKSNKLPNLVTLADIQLKIWRNWKQFDRNREYKHFMLFSCCHILSLLSINCVLMV